MLTAPCGQPHGPLRPPPWPGAASPMASCPWPHAASPMALPGQPGGLLPVAPCGHTHGPTRPPAVASCGQPAGLRPWPHAASPMARSGHRRGLLRPHLWPAMPVARCGHPWPPPATAVALPGRSPAASGQNGGQKFSGHRPHPPNERRRRGPQREQFPAA